MTNEDTCPFCEGKMRKLEGKPTHNLDLGGKFDEKYAHDSINSDFSVCIECGFIAFFMEKNQLESFQKLLKNKK